MAKKSTETENQVAMLSELTQGAVAFALDVSIRAVRDYPGLHRTASGAYDIRDVLRFHAGRVAGPKLTEFDTEKTLNAIDTIFDVVSDKDAGATVGIAEFLAKLQSDYGDAGLLLFATELTKRFSQRAAEELEYWRQTDLSDAELRRRIELEFLARQKVERERRARARLDYQVICEDCARIRRGGRWVKGDPDPGRHVVKSYCGGALGCEFEKK